MLPRLSLPSPKAAWALARGAGVLLLWRCAWLYAAWRFSGMRPNLQSLEAHRLALQTWAASDPMRAWAVYGALYTAVCALLLDGTATLVVFSGALFGFQAGLLLSTFGSSLGALGAFLLSRHVLADWLRHSFPRALAWADQSLAQDSGTWLLTARMVPMVSFPFTNLALGLSPMSSTRFLLFSTLGLLPCNAAYVWAGTHLEGIHHFHDLLSPGLWAALAALGALPLAVRALQKRLSNGLKRSV